MRERIIEFLTKENKSSAQFAEDLGVQPSGISHIISGRNKPSLDFVLKMLGKYPFLSTEWILFGKGNMYKENSEPDLFSSIVEKPDMQVVRDTRAENISVKDKEAGLKASPIVPDEELDIERIIWFFADGTFREYHRGK